MRPASPLPPNPQAIRAEIPNSWSGFYYLLCCCVCVFYGVFVCVFVCKNFPDHRVVLIEFSEALRRDIQSDHFI